MAQVEMTPDEARTIDKAIRLLRDRHYSAYHYSKNPEGATAQGHKAEAHKLDLLRYRYTKEVIK